MKLQHALASTAILFSAGLQAAVTGALGGGLGPLATLSGPGTMSSGGTLSGAVNGTITGGAVYATDLPFADDVVPGDRFLSAGPGSGSPATLTFAGAGVSYISFLWGSPDTYNLLTVNSTGAGPNTQTFTAMSLGFPVTDGNQGFNQSVQFSGIGASLITSLVFASSEDAFETASFSATPIPEPETYALMLAGLGAMGFVGRRRQRVRGEVRGIASE